MTDAVPNNDNYEKNMNEIKKISQVTEIISYGMEIISCEKKFLNSFF
jgi:hypothetical protein